jgi:folate-dependent phosphoribosylglycinamide formyltransferase PurN
MSGRRALFLASPVPEAAAAMRGWIAAGNEIAGLWRPESRKSGGANRDARLGLVAPRWSALTVARRHGVPVSVVPRLSSWAGRLDALRAARADVLVSVYFPFVVPPDMLDLFGAHAVNLHPAPLPRYRGPSPFHAMIVDRTIEEQGTMTLHVMSAGLDEGDIVARRRIAFPADRSFVGYRIEAARMARRLLQHDLPAFLDGRIAAVPQDPAVASYIRTNADDLALSAAMSADDIRWRCDALARFGPLRLAGQKGVSVVGFGGRVGEATGRPPRIGRFTVDMDCADGRVRLLRKRPWTSPWRRLRTLASYVAARDPDRPE